MFKNKSPAGKGLTFWLSFVMSNCEVVTFPLVSSVIASFHDLCPLSYFDHHHHYTHHYQSPLILTELFEHNLINVSYLTACYLYQVMMTLHFLNDVANDTESTQKSKFTS